jgi:hypothetical protein
MINPYVVGASAVAVLFAGIFILLEVGRSLRAKANKADLDAVRAGLSAVESALFGLMGLILAFMFAGASTRFDVRRHLIIEESNTISTAYLFLDLLPGPAQQELKAAFREYVDARLSLYAEAKNFAKIETEKRKVANLQSIIWEKSIAAIPEMKVPQAAVVLFPSLTKMFDIANTRLLAVRIHPPFAVFLLLFVVTLVCALLIGFELGGAPTRQWMHILGFAIMLTMTIYTIVDMEFPRLGLIRMQSFDQALIDLRNNLK